MNIVNSLTFRHLKSHKKRSILTIMAIIVSVSMVTAVFTSAISFFEFMKNCSIAIDGDWHISFVAPDNAKTVEFLSHDKDVDSFGTRISLGNGNYSAGEKDYSFLVKAVDKNWLDITKVRLDEGRYPQNSSEVIAIKKAVKQFELGWRLGSEIELDSVVGEDSEGKPLHETKKYKIVGFTDSSVAATDGLEILFAGIDDETIKNASDILTVVRFDKLDNSVWKKADIIENGLGVNYKANIELFSYSFVIKNNNMMAPLVAFIGILLLIIAVVSIFMIYDSFAVSYQERAKYLGMLASVGATKKQKRASVYFEGLIFGLIGIPLGIFAGIAGIAVTFKCIEKAFLSTMAVDYNDPMKVHINLFVILATVIFSALTIFVSAYIPAKKASKTTAIDAIKQTNNYSTKKIKKVKTSKIAQKFLGYEGALAVKNYKRNGKRSRTIVFSLALSVIVFLTVANFSMMSKKSFEMNFLNYPDITVSLGSFEYADKFNEIMDSIPEIKESNCEVFKYVNADKSMFSEEAKSRNCYPSPMLIFLDNKSFDEYLNQLGENVQKYHDRENPLALIYNCSVISEGDKKVSIVPFEKTDEFSAEIPVVFDDQNGTAKYNAPIKMKVGLITQNNYNNDKFLYRNIGQPLILLSIDHAEKMLKNDYRQSFKYDVSIFCDNSEKIAALLSEKAEKAVIPAVVRDSNSQMKTETNILTIARVFIYGFITLITMISILNIVNTISNSMNERRREFAMLRSVGMTLPGFRKMIYYESFRYGLVALMWSIPISIAIQLILYRTVSESFDYGMPSNIGYYIAAVIAVFLIIGISLLYSVGRIKNDNIIEKLKDDIV